MLVEYNRRHHAGRRRGDECLCKWVAARLESSSEIATLGFDRCRVRIADLANRLRQSADVFDRFPLRRCLVAFLHENRIAFHIRALTALPRAAETAQAVPNVEHERVALLLAIVADIDAGLDLLGNTLIKRRLSFRLKDGGIDRLAARAASVKSRELSRPRKAASVSGQNPVLAVQHFRSFAL